MEKTKLGISVGLFGALVFAAALFGGYMSSIIILGYVLLFESNEWLKKSAVKAVAALVAFSFVTAVIGLVPDAINWVANVINTFGGNVRFEFINDVFSDIKGVISILKDLVFLGLIYKALNQGTIKLPVVDDLINKYM
ncbi:hypothetical protein SAMN02910275_01326 [Butyrivibrio sp. INlla18]|uniref:hypothetical protein n=1 Tax=Butyrivibrio sp. INlla18 TaxID=1520806 RepID=UPI00088977B1|nr:hypothetical protein [Butyrivibrio sp. INlla18]SDA57456.1 hypothetical protein SAMN02910275_01326 [Butyrivibrio sp. INlla18]